MLSDGSVQIADAGTIVGCPPGVHPVPAAPIYECAPLPSGESGCPSEGAASGAGIAYPIGCQVLLPTPQGGCVGACCGAQVCTCQSVPALPGVSDAGAAFVCPL